MVSDISNRGSNDISLVGDLLCVLMLIGTDGEVGIPSNGNHPGEVQGQNSQGCATFELHEAYR